MSKVYIFLANGFEEIEGLTPVDVLRRGGIEVVTVSVSGDRMVTGSRGIPVMADALFEESDFSDADFLVLPGGKVGTENLGAHQGLARLLEAEAGRKWIAAICAAPTVLGGLGLLKGQKATCHPGLEAALEGAECSTDTVVVSGRFVTSRGMGTAIPFSLQILSILTDQETVARVCKGMVWTC